MDESFEKISREVEYDFNAHPASKNVNDPWENIDPWTCVKVEKVLRSIIFYKGNVKEYAKVLLLACHRAAEKSSEEMYKASA